MDEHIISMEDINAAQPASASDSCIPLFHMRVVEDKAEAEKTGKRAYKEIAYVKVLSPGNDKEIPDLVVTEELKQRWPVQWANFSAKKEAPLEGTPIDEWAQINPVQAKILQDEHCLTVEQLANLPDANLQNLGQGFIVLKGKAEAFLASLDGEAGFQKLKAENKKQASQISSLVKQIKDLEAALKKLDKPARK